LPSLLDLQRDFGRALREPDGDLSPWIAGGDAAQRLAFYRGTIHGALVKTLRLSFPTVERLVGSDFFGGAASLFAQAHPATSAYLNEYGGEFPSFLAGLSQCASLVYLPDVAQLDWAVARALQAPDALPLPADALAQRVESAHSLCFVAHPSVSLVRSAFPIHQIWRAVLARDEAGLASIDLAAGAAHLIVQRIAEEVEVLAIDSEEWLFSEALLTGMPFGHAIERAEVDAAACLARHLAQGRIVGVVAHHEQEAT
jgi:hypothetical protein